MNTIEFRVERVRGGGLDEPVIVPFVDGVSLAVLAEAFERAHGHAYPSDYTGLPIDEQASPVARYGIDPPAFENDEWEPGAVPLLDCSCLCSGCRPIVTWPEERNGVIVWRRLSYPRSDDSYEGFGPFIFDREQYDSALADLQRQLG